MYILIAITVHIFYVKCDCSLEGGLFHGYFEVRLQCNSNGLRSHSISVLINLRADICRK